jgi:DnaJ-class molecular chaperone
VVRRYVDQSIRRAFDRRRGNLPRIEEIKISDQTKDCEACFGTGNEPRMRTIQPSSKILFRPCPACGGSGKAPLKEQS